MIGDPARSVLLDGITVHTFIYSSPESLASQWRVAPDGSASSEVCGHITEGQVAGNIAVGFDGFGGDPAGIWPRVVDVVRDLASRIQ